MDILTILAIIQTATGIAQDLAHGTPAEGSLKIAAALEDIVSKTVSFHMEAVGTPMDLSKFHHQDHIE